MIARKQSMRHVFKTQKGVKGLFFSCIVHSYGFIKNKCLKLCVTRSLRDQAERPESTVW